ncbi:MAG: hypothetical protein J6Y85_05370 [Alphaproteobacteria bacterium]|nr:hypothetical protein [Alphaproteobacteria bacterium]
MENLTELEEQQRALARMRITEGLVDDDKKWLKKACCLARFLRCWPNQGLPMCCPQGAVEATFVLSKSYPKECQKKYSDLFLSEIGEEEQRWVKNTLASGDLLFHQSRFTDDKGVHNFSADEVYNPVEISEGLALALDDSLFRQIQPNIFILAEMNAYQKSKGMWPTAIGNKVQYLLEKRFAKEMETLKRVAYPTYAASHIQERWLTPIAEKGRYTDSDAVRIDLICGAAYRAGIPLDQGYLQFLKERAEEKNPQLAQDIVMQAKRHKKLHCSQVTGLWPCIRRWLNLDKTV